MPILKCPHLFRQSLKALEAKIAQDGIVFTEAQLHVLEKRRNDKEACGEIDTHHSGYLGCQDTYYVGNFKGKVYFSGIILIVIVVE